MMTGVSGTSALTVASTSSIAGGIVTGDGNDYLDVYGNVSGGISTGLGDDDLDVFAGATLTGTINMGAGDNVIHLGGEFAPTYLAGTTYMFSDIDTGAVAGASVDISGTSGANEILLITDGFGTSGSTMTVEGSVETLMFNEAGTTLAGNLDTANGSAGITGTVNVFDASGLTGGDALINANGVSSWDVMASGGNTGSVELIGNSLMTGGTDVTLVDNYNNLDLGAWNHSDISLALEDASGAVVSTVTLTWQAAGDYAGSYADANANAAWQLSEKSTNDLVLSKLAVV
jgi:hypothetical protein